jgi:LysR family glycine cleavage system transcriptional activator
VDRQEDKLADDVDVAIFYGRGNWPGLRVEKLYAEYLLPVCSPLLLTGDKPLKTPDDLAKHTLLHDASRRLASLYAPAWPESYQRTAGTYLQP